MRKLLLASILAGTLLVACGDDATQVVEPTMTFQEYVEWCESLKSKEVLPLKEYRQFLADLKAEFEAVEVPAGLESTRVGELGSIESAIVEAESFTGDLVAPFHPLCSIWP